MAGDQQRNAKQPGEGGELLGGAGALAVGGDDHRLGALHHQTGRQTHRGQGLSRAGRAGQHDRRLVRDQR
jgi:hypothetical protein